MNDDLERRLGTALRERFPMPTDVDLLSRLERPVGQRTRLRVIGAAAACVAAVVALSIVLALRGSNASHQPAAAAPLTGVSWQGSAPALTVAFTDRTVRIFDGCTNELREVTIGDGALDIGNTIGPSSTCSGTPNGPPPNVAAFDAVLFRHHLTWQRAGNILRLTNDRGQAVELRADGPALSVTGQQWRLERYNDPRDYTHLGGWSAARLLITADGSVHASDLCNDLTGTARLTDVTITFTGMHSTKRACTSDDSAAVAAVVDQVLSGKDTYTIRGDELIIYGKQPGALMYTPSP